MALDPNLNKQEEAQMKRTEHHPWRTTPTRRAAAERYEQAMRALCQNYIDEYAAGTGYETDEYLRVNRAIPEARRDVPWWRRQLIDRRVIRELDYWARTGQAS